MENEKLTWRIMDRIIGNDTAAYQFLRDRMQLKIMRQGQKWGLNVQDAATYFNEVCAEMVFSYQQAQVALDQKYPNCESYFQTIANRHLVRFIWRTRSPVRIPKSEYKELRHPDQLQGGGTDDLELHTAAKLPIHEMALNPKILKLYENMKTLGEKCQELIKLHYIDGYKWDEIAHQKEQTMNAVTVAGNRCMEKLRALVIP
jgi:DNA-directed RNA polymerase specialized sigma24 family protein